MMARRTTLVDGLVSVLERQVTADQEVLLRDVVEGFVDKLQVNEAGLIRNTLYNKRLLASIDTIFKKFGSTRGVEFAQLLANGVQQVTQFNGEYYRLFATAAQILPIQKEVEALTKDWLGLTNEGRAHPNGYLYKIVQNAPIQQQIKNFALNTVIGGKQGWQKTKTDLRALVTGNEKGTGIFGQYYRNFVYDMYSQVDRATSTTYANKLGFEFAIYEGGLIKTSRQFCIDHNGNVYHISEIEKFNPGKAKQPSYNPFLDLGGYGCRHHLNWIPTSLALIMRPDAKKFVKGAA